MSATRCCCALQYVVSQKYIYLKEDGIMAVKYWSEIVRALDPYVPGEQPKVKNLVKLNTNENPYGPSPQVVHAIHEEAGDGLRLYPDPNSDRLKETIAAYYGLEQKQVFVGNGSDEVLAHVFCALFKHESPLLYPDITYSFYPVYCGLYDITYRQIPLAEDFSIRVDDYMCENGGIIFANPNAPTGRMLALSEVERLLQVNRDSVLVLDEAYVDFGADSGVDLIAKYDNLLIVQTLSKSRSLAGLRVGFALGHVDLIEALERVKNSFNSYPLDRLAVAGAVAAFGDTEYFEKTRREIMVQREHVTEALKQRGFKVLPSQANFIFACCPAMDAALLAAQLRERKVLVRHFRKPKRIEQYLRISIGTEEQCQVLLSAVDDIFLKKGE